MRKEVWFGIIIVLLVAGIIYFDNSGIVELSPRNFDRVDRSSAGLEESKTGIISQARQEACAESASLLKELDQRRTLDGGTPADLKKAVEECLQEKKPEGDLKDYLNEVSSQRGGSCVPAVHDIVPNGEVDVFDLIELLNNWGATGQNIADVNGDEVVDTFDLLQLLNMWDGILCECGNNVVEPGEQCDDGNTNNGDGCSSQCTFEGGPISVDVCTAVDLDNVRNDLFGIYKQTCDIDLSGVNFEPIGDLNAPFMGTYDGQEFVIRNFNFVDQERNRVGLFGMAGTSPNKGALIRNVHLENANVEGKANVGSLAGMTFGSTIENSSVRDSVVIGQELLNPGHAPFVIEPYTGGLVGHLHPGSKCVNCEAFDTEVRGKTVVGGLIGNVHGSQLLDSRSVNPRVIGNGEMVGGLAGWTQFDQFTGSTNLIQDSYAENVDVVNVNLDGNYTGGVVGLLDVNSHVTESYVDGGSVEGLRFTGGLIGWAEDSEVDNCYASTEIVKSIDGVPAATFTGGLIGWAENGMLIENCFSSGKVEGGTSIGGALGYVSGQQFFPPTNLFFPEPNVIKGVYSFSDVESNTWIGIVGGFVGGFIGNSTIEDSYALGDVEGPRDVGGFVGRVALNATLVNVYAANNITKTGATPGEAGGLIGHVYHFSSYPYTGEVISSYWNVDNGWEEVCGTDQILHPCNWTDNNVLGLTTEDMASVPRPGAAFVGWDFENIWDQVDGDYPFLR